MMPFIDLKKQYQKINTQIQDNINTVLDHGQYIMGPEVNKLEEKLAGFVGTKHCIGLSSGTDALLVALMAVGVGPDDEVITPNFSFFATAGVVSFLKARPIFVDVDAKTYNIDPMLIEKKITKKTKAIMPVSLYGQCPDFDSINRIALKYNIPVIEDAAQSFGATYKKKKSCGLSTIGCTSFFPSKPLGCYGDGGACFTDDDNLAKIMREIRLHGQESRYYHTRIGINGRLDSLQAAILLAKLEIFDEEIVLRSEIGRYYSKALQDVVTVPFIEEWNTSVYGQYTIQVDQREKFQSYLKGCNIPTAIHYQMPIDEQPIYKDIKSDNCPISRDLASKVISLPMHPYLERGDQDQIIDIIRKGHE